MRRNIVKKIIIESRVINPVIGSRIEKNWIEREEIKDPILIARIIEIIKIQTGAIIKIRTIIFIWTIVIIWTIVKIRIIEKIWTIPKARAVTKTKKDTKSTVNQIINKTTIRKQHSLQKYIQPPRNPKLIPKQLQANA